MAFGFIVDFGDIEMIGGWVVGECEDESWGFVVLFWFDVVGIVVKAVVEFVENGREIDGEETSCYEARAEECFGFVEGCDGGA